MPTLGRKCSSLLWLISVVLLTHHTAHVLADEPTAHPAPSGFTDVTRSSGVAAVVEKHYQLDPQLWLSGMTLADFDGDGHLDLHLAGHGHPAVIGYNDGHGHFTSGEAKLEPGGRVNAAEVQAPGGEIRLLHDLNEDGKLDVLAAYGDGLGVAYLNGSKNGPPRAASFKAFTPGFAVFSRAVAVADLNRDGRVDYLMHGDGASNTHSQLFFGQPNGRWSAAPDLDTLVESSDIPVDLNGDGFLDLLVSQRGYNPTGRKILLNDGQMHFRDATKECGLDENAGSIHGYGDLNQDGSPDLICVEGRDVVIYLNDGHGHFTKGPPVPGIDKAEGHFHSANWGGAIVTDFDNDGVPDILVNGKGALYLLRGLGGGKFTVANAAWGLPSAIEPAVDEGACFGDVDGDGRLDLVTCGRPPPGKERGVSVWHNELPPQHWLRVQLIGAPGNAAAISAKIRLYQAGGLHDPKKLCWYEQTSLWGRQSFYNYYAMRHTERHFGLGPRDTVDLSVEFYPSGKRVEKHGVPSDQIVTVDETSGRVAEAKPN